VGSVQRRISPMTEARAPGKLILCGEYAVLCGAPAIAVAVDVHARAWLSSSGDACRLSIAGSGSWPFDWDDGGMPRWIGAAPGQQGRILEAVAATLAARGVSLPARTDIGLDTRAFQAEVPGGGAAKLGLGSSAAITVALVAALLDRAQGKAPDRAILFDVALDAHRRFQHGGGSGVDVAAAIHGGVVLLEPAGEAPRIRPLVWPARLHWIAAWSGTSASTVDLLARFDAFRAADPARFGRQIEVLADIATATARAWQRQAVPDLLQLLADYDDALRALDEGGAIGIYTPAHDRLALVAQSAGAIYKVSGAGGGDFGLAFADSADVIARLAAEFARLGVLSLTGTGEVPGVAVSAAAP
jgi:phosphomevalonate kinase